MRALVDLPAPAAIALALLCGCPARPDPLSASHTPASVSGAQPREAAPSPETDDTPAVDAGLGGDAAAASPLRMLSLAWAKDSELGYAGVSPTIDVSRCGWSGDGPWSADPRIVPEGSAPFGEIATHACDAVLSVLLMCTEADDTARACAHWQERLVLESRRAAPRVLGQIEPQTGGNSGGIFVPFAFTRDDRTILLRAWMFPPGAGGGAVDYGYGVIERSPARADAPLEVRPLGARDPRFYDGFGCAIGLAASSKTPSYTQPGAPADNGGALVVVDLATLRTRTLLEERDTTYAVEALDETARAVLVAVTGHRFGKDCPREEGALNCSESSTKARTIPLPACGRPR